MATIQAPVPVAKVRSRLERTGYTDYLLKGMPSQADLIILGDGGECQVYPAIWPHWFVVSVPKGGGA